MELQNEVKAFQDLFASANSTAILLPANVNRDAVAAALSLYLSMAATNKKVAIACPRPPIVGWSHLVGVDKIVQNLGKKNFIISLDYTEGSIEKVSYNIEGNKFNLVIEPREGAPLFDERKVNYNYVGMNADLIVTVAATTLESLGKYYTDNKQLFQEKPIIVVEQRSIAQYGRVNLVQPVSTLSEIVAYLIKVGQLPINPDIASNLYDGIVVGSRNFTTQAVNADTFEITSWLIRQGARKTYTRQEELPRGEVVGQPTEAPTPPPDWLKPKIFKGGQML